MKTALIALSILFFACNNNSEELEELQREHKIDLVQTGDTTQNEAPPAEWARKKTTIQAIGHLGERDHAEN
jgi:hypothetical protein